MPDRMAQTTADLHWLALLLTGRSEINMDLTARALARTDNVDTFFSSWMRAWSRRLFIARTLLAVREELAASVRRMASGRIGKAPLPPAGWTLDRNTTRSALEQALLAIDLFPRAALLLLIYERASLKDAAVLLNAAPDVVRKAMAAGARDLTVNLARMQGWNPAAKGYQHV